MTAVVILFVAVQGYLAYGVLEQQEDDLVDDVVRAETRRLAGRLSSGEVRSTAFDPTYRLAPNMVAWLVASPGSSVSDLPRDLQPLSDGQHVRHSPGRVVHASVVTTDVGRLFIEYDATNNEAFVEEFGSYLVFAGLAFIGLSWLVSMWVARIVVLPIQRLATLLSEWSPGSPRTIGRRPDEQSLLLLAFDQAQRRVDEALSREREFAANVRHEIRTPLAALRTDAEMIQMTESFSPTTGERLRRMIATVDMAVEAMEAAQSLSSAWPARPEKLNLRDCVDRVWASLQHLNPDSRSEFRNQVDPTRSEVLDRHALMTILRNLMRNAIEHASPGICTVRSIDDGIEVSDNGPGIAPELLPHVFERYVTGRLVDTRGPPGARPAEDRLPPAEDRPGLGLAIARQSAIQQGWTLGVTSSRWAGTAFTLRFFRSSASAADPLASSDRPTQTSEERTRGSRPAG